MFVPPPTRVSILVSPAQAQALRDALLTSRRALDEEADHAARALARGEPASERLARARRARSEVVRLIDQLERPRAPQLLTAEREPLRSALCDALLVAIERLAAATTRYWRIDSGLEALEVELGEVAEHIHSLRALGRGPPAER